MERPLRAGLGVGLLLACGGLASGQTEYRLSEHLGFGWTNELISFSVTFPANACKALRLVMADEKPVVFQAPAEGTTRHADGSIAAARVYVKTDLAPDQTIVFRALDDQAAGKATPAVVGSVVGIEEKNQRVTLESGPVGVRLPLGEFTKDIPSPYQRTITELGIGCRRPACAAGRDRWPEANPHNPSCASKGGCG